MFERVRDFFVFRSVRSRLMAASIACILLPAFFTLLIYNNLTQDAVKKQAVSNSQESLLLVNGSVTSLLKGMLNIANYVQTNSDMTSYFKVLASGAYPKETDEYTRFMDAKRITDQLRSLAAIGENSYVTVLLTDGTYFTTYQSSEYDPLLFMKEPWFHQLSQLSGFQSYWTGPTPTVFSSDRQRNPYQLSVVRTLRRDDTNIYGYVIVTFLENQLNRIFSQLSGGEEVMILDEQRRIISYPDPSRIEELAPFGPLAVGDQAASDVIPINGVNHLVTEQTLPFTGWHLVSMQPYRQAIVNTNTIFSKVFVFQLASFIVFLLLLLYLLRKFTMPLVRLGKTAGTVQRGNLTVRSGVRGVDEIGRLGNSFDLMLDKVNEMIDEVSDTQARKRRAELAMLQAQINPHFLFNVLNSIRMKVMKRGDADSAKMIAALSKLLRMTVSQEQDEITLHEELDLLTNYVDLMNMRQKEAVELQYDVSAEALLVKVPRFFLQPVVENAIIHGLNRKAGTIVVQGTMEPGALLLKVKDNGTGMDASKLETLRGKIDAESGKHPEQDGTGGGFSGIGLPNVSERMRMTFGEAFRMEVQSIEGEGTTIQMDIPWESLTRYEEVE
ncbi:sensor histidine kinase [Paenibacillus cremeus]|uniref:histidine kinase n=1 Tax=Paenibacillus cremeus TaxID=2163881 RepID=A0A559JK40_9BACL|nr:sensor histidine kinase [Paenibacillus cremeus]TVY00257.1 HAMP domain-containing protein [Paenibacillus cremeus]